MNKFAVAGIVQIETIVKVDRIPVEYSPVVNKPNTIFTNVGGDAYNECLALRALGNNVAFFTMTGKDNTDMIVKDKLISEADYVFPALDATPTAVILYDENRKQQIYEDIKNVRDVVYPIDPFKKNISDADCVVLANANFCRPLAKAVYLRLGDKEEKARNPVMASVGDAIRRQQALLAAQGISHMLEWNAGNHFVDADIRMAKGFAWLMKQ